MSAKRPEDVGAVSAAVLDVLEQRAGFDAARDPFGQIAEPGWYRAGLPVETGEPEGRSYAELKKKRGGGRSEA